MRIKTSVPWKNNDSAYFYKPTSRGIEQWKRLPLWSSKRRHSNPLFSRESFGYISGNNNSGRNGENKIVCFASRETGSIYTWPDNQKPRVCILGGGFGGLYTALRLESLEWPNDKKPQVLLVDQSEDFVFKPMLYELLSGEVDAWEIAPSFKDLLENTNVKFVKDKVKILKPSDYLLEKGPEILKSGGTVHLESGIIVEYDWYLLRLIHLLNSFMLYDT